MKHRHVNSLVHSINTQLKYVHGLLPVLFVLVAIYGFSSHTHAQSEIQVFTEELAPLQYLENDKVSGFTTDKVNAIFAKAKLTPNIKILPWARAINKVQSTPNTLIYSLARYEEREEKYQWIGQVATINFAMVGLNSTPPILSITDAKKLRLGVVRNDFSHELLEKHHFIEHENYTLSSDYYRLMRLLYLGQIDAIISDIRYMKEMAAKLEYDASQITELYRLPNMTVPLYLAANKQSEYQLIKRLKEALQKVEAEQ